MCKTSQRIHHLFLFLKNIAMSNDPDADSTSNTILSTVEEERQRSEGDQSTSMPYEFTPGFRPNSTLLYSICEKQLYRRHCSLRHVIRYQCTTSKCSASLALRGDVLFKFKDFQPHNHPTVETKMLKNRFRDKLRMAITASSENIRTVYDEQLKGYLKKMNINLGNGTIQGLLFVAIVKQRYILIIDVLQGVFNYNAND